MKVINNGEDPYNYSDEVKLLQAKRELSEELQRFVVAKLRMRDAIEATADNFDVDIDELSTWAEGECELYEE